MVQVNRLGLLSGSASNWIALWRRSSPFSWSMSGYERLSECRTFGRTMVPNSVPFDFLSGLDDTGPYRYTSIHDNGHHDAALPVTSPLGSRTPSRHGIRA